MNKKLFYGAFAFAALGLASCSSDEPVINGGNSNISLDGENYVAVRIMTPGAGTRAMSADYDPGTDQEGTLTAANTRFFFFDESGNPFSMVYSNNVNGVVTTNMVQPASLENDAVQTEGQTPTGTAVLVLGKKDPNAGYEGIVPYQAVCIANAASWDGYDNITLEALAKKVDTKEDGRFVMSSSNYDGVQDRQGATILANSIYDKPGDAEQNPVDFWMDRLAVKVQIEATKGLGMYASKNTVTYTGQDAKGVEPFEGCYKIYKEDGTFEYKTLYINLQDWQLLNDATTAYTIKQLPTGADVPAWAWSSADYHRSFWADSEAITTDVEGFEILEEGKWITDAQYCYEMTHGNATAQSTRGTTSTAMAVRGYLYEYTGAETEAAEILADKQNFKKIEIVKWSGQYYEMAAIKYIIANKYNTSDGAVKKVLANEVDFVRTTNNRYKAIYNGETATVGEGDDAKTLSKGDDLGTENILYWKDSATSFVLNIEQADANGNATGAFGVVRNHVYSYSFDGVNGLGVPGDDVTTDKETETYLAARVNVLQWRVVSNSVTLE